MSNVGKTLQVSRATAGFISRGHPWVRPDRFTRGLDRLRAGEAVTLVDEQGHRLASALVDPADEVCARVFHRLPDKQFDPRAAVARAWDRRAALHAEPATDCYRIVHGEGDFLPGLRVERYAQVLVVVVLADVIVSYVEQVCAALAALMPSAEIVIRDHREDLRRKDTATRRWPSGKVDPEAQIIGRECGVPVVIKPFAGLATGIYVDQRGTRLWLRPQAAGKRVLNLFAYTGLFSTSLLEAGASLAVDVDLSAPALAIATENARLAGVAARHRTMHGECRKVLAGMTETFDLVIVDPPTSAQGDGGWILRRDYPDVLTAAWARTAPGGLLIACCNTLHGKPYRLADAVSGACAGGRVLPAATLAEDVPLLKGFPEGRPWQQVALRRPS